MSTPDQTERVILTAAEETVSTGCPCDVLVIDDATGTLTEQALTDVVDHPQARVLSWTASYAGAQQLRERFAPALAAGRLLIPAGPEAADLETFAATAEAHLVLARLPKSLRALDERARALARAAHATAREDLTLIAGGRVKHMTRTQNDVLAASFADVAATRGIGKSRALVAQQPVPDVAAHAAARNMVRFRVRGAEVERELHGIGGVFGGARPDAGSLLLLEALDDAVQDGALDAVVAAAAPEGRVIDLGCGNGLLTLYLAAAFPDSAVLSSDDDADAVASTRATLAGAAEGNPPGRVDVTWDRSLSREADGTADLVLLNPPFHDGPGIDATLAPGMLAAAARVLRPGGQLWLVHNSHLRYRRELERQIGSVQQRARDSRFTVLSAIKR